MATSNFERHKDPKEAMGMGLYRRMEFRDDYEAVPYLMKIIPILLEIPSIENFSVTQMKKIEQYTIDYIFIKESFMPPDLLDASLIFLLKETIRNHLQDELRKR